MDHIEQQARHYIGVAHAIKQWLNNEYSTDIDVTDKGTSWEFVFWQRDHGRVFRVSVEQMLELEPTAEAVAALMNELDIRARLDELKPDRRLVLTSGKPRLLVEPTTTR